MTVVVGSSVSSTERGVGLCKRQVLILIEACAASEKVVNRIVVCEPDDATVESFGRHRNLGSGEFISRLKVRRKCKYLVPDQQPAGHNRVAGCLACGKADALHDGLHDPAYAGDDVLVDRIDLGSGDKF